MDPLWNLHRQVITSIQRDRHLTLHFNLHLYHRQTFQEEQPRQVLPFNLHVCHRQPSQKEKTSEVKTTLAKPYVLSAALLAQSATIVDNRRPVMQFFSSSPENAPLESVGGSLSEPSPRGLVHSVNQAPGVWFTE